MKSIDAGEFKAKCLALLAEVTRKHETVLVTKRGIPIAKISPVTKKYEQPPTLRGSVLLEKSLVAPVDDAWKAD